MKFLAAALLLASCSPASDGPDVRPEDQPADWSEDEPSPCASRIIRIEPQDGAHDVPVHLPVVATLDLPLPPEGHVSFAVVQGEPVDGSFIVSPDRRLLIWHPNSPLGHGATHQVTIQACADERTTTFLTAPARVDVDQLIGRSWTVALDALSWLAPASSALLDGMIDAPRVALTLTGPPEAPHLHLRGEVAACEVVVDLGRLDLSANPSFSTEPVDLDLDLGGAVIRARQVVTSGTLREDGLDDLGLSALLDLAPLAPMLPGADLCWMSRVLGEPCGPCGDGAETCVPVVLTAPVAQASMDPPRAPAPDCAPP